MCRQLDNYSTGKEIPKVELRVTSDNPHEPLDHTIKLTGVIPPHDSIKISRPLQEPPLSESVDGQQERPAEQQKRKAEQQKSRTKQQERKAEQRKSRTKQQERPAEQQEKPVQQPEKLLQQPGEPKGQRKRPTTGNLLVIFYHTGTAIMYFGI